MNMLPNEPHDGAPASESTDGAAAASPGLWRDLRAAVRGSAQHDYTSGPVGRAVLLLAVPMVLETVAESIFAVVDIFFVTKLGAWAAATVALTESLLTLIYTVALGLSIGVTAMVARRIGEKDPDGAARVVVQAIALGLAVSAVIGVGGLFFADDVLRAMGADEQMIAEGVSYTRIMLVGNATVLLLFLINAAFRGAGDAVIAMRVLWIANGINVLLDPALIFGWGFFPELGIQGAAIATNIGRGTAVVVQFFLLARSGGHLAVARRHLRVIPQLMRQLWHLSATGMFQVFIGMASWIGLIRILAGFGAEVLAGYAIGIRLVIFALLPSFGMSNAAATMVGQALGAGKPDRAERAVWIAGRYNVVFLGVVGVLFFAFAPPIVSFFASVGDPSRSNEVVEIVRWGVLCLRIVSLGFVFYAYGMVLTQSFNGAGDAWTPTWINLFIFWLFELPFAWVLAYQTGLGPIGVFISMTVSFSLLAVVSGVLFKRGRWKLKAV